MSLTERDQDGQQQAELKKTLQKFVKLCVKNRRLTVRSITEQVNINRETVRKILTEDLDMRKVCAKNGPKGAHRRTKAKKSHNLPRSFVGARWHFGTVSSQVTTFG